MCKEYGVIFKGTYSLQSSVKEVQESMEGGPKKTKMEFFE